MPSAVRIIGIGIGAGLCGGSFVGAAEALYLLQSIAPGEYQAIGYAWTLYGAVGAPLGLAAGCLLMAGSRWMSDATVWCLAFAAVVCTLGFAVTHHLVDQTLYAEAGVPLGDATGLLAAFLAAAVGGVWLGANLLTKTPLRALTRAKGTAAAWFGGLGLSWVFALSPAPSTGGETDEPARALSTELQARPDIVVVVVDSLRADALGSYGAPADATPHLDAFAKDSVTFDQFITSASWTRPSVASLFTSMAVSSHACASSADRLVPEVQTLAEALHERGYRTAGWPNSPNISAAQGFGQGFDVYPYEPDFPLGARESTFGLSVYRLLRGRLAMVQPEARVEAFHAPAEVQISQALAHMRREHTTRDFLFVHLMEPHDPWFSHPPDGTAVGQLGQKDPLPSDALSLRARYAGEVAWADEQLGIFFDALRADGRYDDAVIVVTSDHGEEFFEHGAWWHGTSLYDEQVRVPLLLKLPKGRYAGTRVPWQVRQVDIAPTLVDLAGALPPDVWQGQGLFPDSFDADLALLIPPEEAVSWSPPDWTTHPASRDALSEETFAGFQLQSLRRGGRKIVEALRVPGHATRVLPRVQYFSLGSDPGEQRDLHGDGSGDEAGLKATLQSMVDDRRRKSVSVRVDEVSDAERCRLCALGYLAGVDCVDCAAP